MKRTYKYRIYPNRAQREALSRMLYFCRFLYNCALEERITYYKRFHKTLSYADQCKALPNIRKEFASEAGDILAQSLQQVLKQLDTAYKNFFRRVKEGSGEAGFPRFKGEGRFRSICFPQPLP
jgi:putative transposase